MCSTKKIRKAAQKFRRENPDLYNECAFSLSQKALRIRQYGPDDKN